MKQKWIRSDIPLSPSRNVSMLIFSLSIAVMLTSCFLKQDRTTTVYGTVTDQNGQPVDSILVLIQGMRYLTLEVLTQVYSKENGSYEIVFEVPKKFGSINATIPFLINANPKYQNNYKGKKTTKNGKRTDSCCIASVGEKTKFDFQLIPK